MKLKVLCDCDDNKVCMSNFDGELMWHYLDKYPEHKIPNLLEDIQRENQLRVNEWFKDEAYKQNSD